VKQNKKLKRVRDGEKERERISLLFDLKSFLLINSNWNVHCRNLLYLSRYSIRIVY